jgi:hypothetical protein
MTTAERISQDITGKDRAEKILRSVDQGTTQRAGVSVFHVLALLSIVASVVLFVSGRKAEGIFVGLWAPTFESLKPAAENR